MNKDFISKVAMLVITGAASVLTGVISNAMFERHMDERFDEYIAQKENEEEA